MTALDFLANRPKPERSSPENRWSLSAPEMWAATWRQKPRRLGADAITLMDVQEPASFGKERQDAEAAGAVFRWPCFTQEITAEGVMLTTGEMIPADHGDHLHRRCAGSGFSVQRKSTRIGDLCWSMNIFRPRIPTIFAIGDAVKPGLLTDAIGSGRKAADGDH